MAKKLPKEATIIEEKQEFMVDHICSTITQNPTKRSAHFLKPILNPNTLPPKLPKIFPFPPLLEPNVVFLYKSTPLKGWKTWVENLEKTHEPAWRKAGIFDAIKCSTYHIAKDTDLIVSLVEKWCPKNNTFVFPWGEATVTLEDVLILGGFSPLGVPVSSSCGSVGKHIEQIEKKLLNSYRELKKNADNLSQKRWQKHFMGQGGKMEYAGFLALWLVRHVFPCNSNSLITCHVFAMAARISCGAKLALGPAVLAALYRDLTLLKGEIVDSLRGRCRDGGALVEVLSLFQLVQVWAWERFPSLGPVPRMIDCGETRLARWECDSRELDYDIVDVKLCLDSSRETFKWRPYDVSMENWPLPRFYVDSGTWVVVNSVEEWELIARCFMVGKLNGWEPDCVERYNPHRVARQFGFDQDIPVSLDGSKAGCTTGGVKGLKLYLPSRLHEGDVTHRYFDWWRPMMNVEEEALRGCKRKMGAEKSVIKMAKTCDTRNELEAIDVAENVRGKSLNKCSHMEESSQNLLPVDNDIDMTCVFHMETGLNSQEDTHMSEEKENEVWTDKHSMGKGSNDSDHSNFHREETENEINISCSKLAEIEPNRSVDQEEGNMKPSVMLPETETQPSCDAMNSLRSQVAAENQNLDNEIGQIVVRCSLIRPEGGSGKSEDVAREQNKEPNLTEHNVKVEKNLECLEADSPQIKTETESNGTLIRVACENEPARALCQGPDLDTNRGTIVPVNGQVAIIDVGNDYGYNAFAALCLNYESRISRLEKEISAVAASNLTRLAITE